MGHILRLKSGSAGIIIDWHRLNNYQLGPRRPAGGDDMDGYYHDFLS